MAVMSAQSWGAFVFFSVATVRRRILELTRVQRVGVSNHTSCCRHRKFMITAQRQHPVFRGVRMSANAVAR